MKSYLHTLRDDGVRGSCIGFAGGGRVLNACAGVLSSSAGLSGGEGVYGGGVGVEDLVLDNIWVETDAFTDCLSVAFSDFSFVTALCATYVCMNSHFVHSVQIEQQKFLKYLGLI